MKRLLTKRSKSFSRGGAQPRMEASSRDHLEELPSLDKASPSASSDEGVPITPSIPQSRSVEMPQLRFSGFDFGALVTEELDLSMSSAAADAQPLRSANDNTKDSPSSSALDSLPRTTSDMSLNPAPQMSRQASDVSSLAGAGADGSVFWDASSSFHGGPASPDITRSNATSPPDNTIGLGLPLSRSMGLADLRARSPAPDYGSAHSVPRQVNGAHTAVGAKGGHSASSASHSPPRAAFLAGPTQQQQQQGPMAMAGATRDKLTAVPVYPGAASSAQARPQAAPSASTSIPPRQQVHGSYPQASNARTSLPRAVATQQPMQGSVTQDLRPSQSQCRIQVVAPGSLPSSNVNPAPAPRASTARSDADIQAQAAAARHAAWEAKQAEEVARKQEEEAAAVAARKEKERLEAHEKAERLAAEQERVLQKEIAKLEREALEAEERERRRKAAEEAEAAQERGRLAMAAARENRAREAARAAQQARNDAKANINVKPSRPQYQVSVGATPATAVVVPMSSAQPPSQAPRRTASAKDARDGAPRYAPRRGATQTESDEALANAHMAAVLRSSGPSSSAQQEQVGKVRAQQPVLIPDAAQQASPQQAAAAVPARPPRRNFNAVLDDRRIRSHDEPVVPPRRTARYDKPGRQEGDDGNAEHGEGWVCHGVGDPELIQDHRRVVKVKTLVPRAVGDKGSRTASGSSTPSSFASAEDVMDGGPVQMEMEEVERDVVYSELFELLWTHTTPTCMTQLVSHLDYSDIKALRQTSSSIRFALGSLHGREIVLRRFLRQVGYRTWQPPRNVRLGSPEASDPLPLSFRDCEAFLLSHDLLPEYATVGHEYAANPEAMDPRLPRLARASCRSYNRVLTRLRLQPVFKVPLPIASPLAGGISPTSPQSSGKFAKGQHGAHLETPTKRSNLSASPSQDLSLPSLGPIPSPWKPGRAAHYRVWVPTQSQDGWLSDEELAACERELQISGIWDFMRRGDVVWDCALGDVKNQGKYIFDGRYLRDLAYTHDVAGHLPSWLNALLFSPSHFHNIIRSSTPDPIIYIDVLPWGNQLLSSLRLVQDHIESTSPQGRYRVAKWLYRAAIDVTGGQIVSNEGLEAVDEGWHGKIVFETEGTAEHAKALISRCAGPAASPQVKAALLASVMGEAAPSALHMPDLSARDTAPPSPSTSTQKVENTTPWAVMRERSRPGLIWLRPVADRARLTPVP